MIEIVGAPFDLGGMRLGSRLGPAALRLAGLEQTIRGLGLEVSDSGDVEVGLPSPGDEGIANMPPFIETVVRLKTEADRILSDGNLPLILGGEHTLSVAGVSAALARAGEGLGLLWIDAHADVNTPGSSMTGNIHGMPIAALAGLPSETAGRRDEQWNELQAVLGPGTPLLLENTAWVGLRDVDEAEKPRLKGLPITMHHIDRFGIESIVSQLDGFLKTREVTHLWVSLDVDVLDPILAPGTGTAVRGGLTYREAHLFAELLHERLTATDCPYRLVGIDIVETNPLIDQMNATAIVAVEWAASLLGKSIT